MTHTLKIKQNFLDDIILGTKTFEVRFNDRNYQLNDDLILISERGDTLSCNVTYLLDNTDYVKEGFVILGICLIDVDLK